MVKNVVEAVRGELGAEYLLTAEAGPVPIVDDRVWMRKQQEHFEEYIDDANGGWLDPEKVREARKEELDWIIRQNVFEKVHESEVGGKKLSLRWIDTVKPGGRYRSRLVVREIKKAKTADEKLDPAEVFSSMPPVEGLKCLISHMMTERKDPDGEDLCAAVWDVSRAHFYGIAERDIYTILLESLPEELHEDGFVAKLVKTMYGTQDAARIWGETWIPLLEAHGIQIGTSNRSVFGNTHLKGLCHGDGFMVIASRRRLMELGDMLESKFDVRRTGILGLGPGFDKELVMLNRTIRISDEDDCIELEPDAKHVHQMVKDLGLQDAKGVDTPRVKMSVLEAQDVEYSPTLCQSGARTYRSATMRAAYLSQERVDINEAVKALSRAMANPREGHLAQVKRLARYLK